MQARNNDISESARNNIVMAHNSELTCSVIDSTTGDICGEKTGLQILNEFRQYYNARIRSIDPNSPNGAQEKMNVMMEWIKDLDAQNTMLVCTVEELEEAACIRVKMLEEKLKDTSNTLTNSISHYSHPSELVLNDLYKRINQLEIDEQELNLKVRNLRSDIRGLIELIRRAATENTWRLDGIRFFEVNLHDLPIPHESIYGQVNESTNTDKKLRIIIELGGPTANYPSSIALCDCPSDRKIPNLYNDPQILL